MMIFNMIVGIFLAIFGERATNLGWKFTLILLVTYVVVQIYYSISLRNFYADLGPDITLEGMQAKIRIPSSINSIMIWALITSIIDNLKIFS